MFFSQNVILTTKGTKETQKYYEFYFCVFFVPLWFKNTFYKNQILEPAVFDYY